MVIRYCIVKIAFGISMLNLDTLRQLTKELEMYYLCSGNVKIDLNEYEHGR